MTKSQRIQYAKNLTKKINLKAEFREFAESGKTSRQACKVWGVNLQHIVKTLILYSKKDDVYACVVLLGSDKLNINKIRKFLKLRKLNLAPQEKVEALTSFKPGGVSPVASLLCKNRFIDRKVIKKAVVYGAGGDECVYMKFSPKKLVKKINGFYVKNISLNHSG
ncbi:MAG: hypothetical protein GF335_04955 [Candidatus Moranbacteria bacterium]|nr:hypothetical protein [Candidatus Moranbacteria bacterium]